MLKKELRLGKRRDFEEIKRKGILRKGECFSVIAGNIVGLKRFAVVVSKKISKKAVERNLIRRKIYRIIGKNMNIFPDNFAGIFLVKKNILNKSEEEMEKCLKSIF